ncbi:MAG: hypothetical protein P4L81_00525 [Candidatus Pacebacteria bacterium]|nr:hypothetical protein [Candidatus Paceibacterota bacterium]
MRHPSPKEEDALTPERRSLVPTLGSTQCDGRGKTTDDGVLVHRS